MVRVYSVIILGQAHCQTGKPRISNLVLFLRELWGYETISQNSFAEVKVALLAGCLPFALVLSLWRSWEEFLPGFNCKKNFLMAMTSRTRGLTRIFWTRHSVFRVLATVDVQHCKVVPLITSRWGFTSWKASIFHPVENVAPSLF